MHKNRLLLSQKGLYTYAMVGILHMAGSCGSKKPNPANIQGTKINTQYINKLGTVAQQTQWLTTTQHTQDISKKSNPGNTQGTKINTQYINKLGTISQQTPPPTDAQNTQNTSKKFKPANTQYINKLDLDEQRTSSPEGKEFQKKTEIVTNPILEEIPKERQQQTPKILKNIVETVIATAKHAIIELGVTSLSTTQQINEINFVQEFHSGIDKAVEAISKVYVPIYPRLDSEKSVNGKYLANKARQIFIIRSGKKDSAEAIMAESVFAELDKIKDRINNKEELVKISEVIKDSFKTEIDKFEEATKNTLNNLKQAVNTVKDHILVAIKIPESTTANQNEIGELSAVNKKLIEVHTTLNIAQKYVNTLKTEAIKSPLIQESLNIVINDLETRIDKLNKATTDAIQTVTYAITDIRKLLKE